MAGIRFSFNLATFEGRSLADLFDRAAAWAFDGVDVPIGRVGTDASAVRNAGVPVACLVTEIAFPDDPRRDGGAGDEVLRAVDVAAAAGANLVRVRDPRAGVRTGDVSAAAMGEWLVPLADRAAAAGVRIAVANGTTFRLARQVWAALDRASHPAAVASWELAAGLAAGESPAVSVPTLNTRIAHATVGKIAAHPAAVRTFLTRLRGVGYRGFVSIDASGSTPADVEAALLADLKTLRGWANDGAPKAAPKAVPKAAPARA